MIEDLKTYLDEQVEIFNNPAFITSDPISIPHRFRRKQDIEISGFIAATLSWGNRTSIISKASVLMQLMENEPFLFLKNASGKDFGKFSHFIYRTFNADDCLFLLQSLQQIYLEYESLEDVFIRGYQKDHDVFAGIEMLRNELLRTDHLIRSEKHLSSPAKGSAAKRINMFLRWMVRKDHAGVDFGIWHKVDQAHLICPLDLHSSNTARKLGLLTRTSNDKKAALELTENLRFLDATDPVKYDFALFGLSADREKSLKVKS